MPTGGDRYLDLQEAPGSATGNTSATKVREHDHASLRKSRIEKRGPTEEGLKEGKPEGSGMGG